MLGDLLKERGIITQDQLDMALKHQARTGEFLGKALLNMGLVSGMELVKALALQERLTLISVDSFEVEAKAIKLIPEEEAVDRLLLPLAKIKETLFVAAPVSVEEKKIKELGEKLKAVIEPIFIVRPTPEFVEIIQNAYHRVREIELTAKRIGSFLKTENLITEPQLQEALATQKETHDKIGHILIEKGYITEAQFYEALSKNLKIPFLSLTEALKALDPEVAGLCSPIFASHYHAVPLNWNASRANVLLSDPHDEYVLDSIKKLLDRSEIDVSLATESTISVIINSIFRGKVDFPPLSVEDITEVERLELLQGYRDPEIPKILNFLLYKAISERASDIHIERYEDRVELRFRIDGVLNPVQFPLVNINNILRVISKLKIDAKLDIAERRKPQDGSFRKRFGKEKLVDFRLAVHPTIFGESAVIRILDQTAKIPSLESLGFSEVLLKRYLRIIRNPQGLILFTGPTGSGKSTTLYATMNILKNENNKIVTAEDPIEYYVDGTQQCQVYDMIGNTFANYLRSFLRADPDIILLGEIRDFDTAEMTVRAALTGHLVFSTIHVNDAVSVIRRLEDLRIDPHLIGQSLLASISQRLVRRICDQCCKEYTPPLELLEEFYPKGVPAGIKFFKGEGCPQCHLTGYKGRIGLFEFWVPDEETKELIGKEKSLNVIKSAAIQKGMKPLLRDGLEKVAQGVTTLEELRTAVSLEEIHGISVS